mmetsp:Transcript_58909/g.127398  ORF Transcript_58909/g.127398 Transcript_58909/m.127398 type:complete len:242 (-) Transcript_58909:1-726(-)
MALMSLQPAGPLPVVQRHNGTLLPDSTKCSPPGQRCLRDPCCRLVESTPSRCRVLRALLCAAQSPSECPQGAAMPASGLKPFRSSSGCFSLYSSCLGFLRLAAPLSHHRCNGPVRRHAAGVARKIHILLLQHLLPVEVIDAAEVKGVLAWQSLDMPSGLHRAAADSASLRGAGAWTRGNFFLGLLLNDSPTNEILARLPALSQPGCDHRRQGRNPMSSRHPAARHTRGKAARPEDSDNLGP